MQHQPTELTWVSKSKRQILQLCDCTTSWRPTTYGAERKKKRHHAVQPHTKPLRNASISGSLDGHKNASAIAYIMSTTTRSRKQITCTYGRIGREHTTASRMANRLKRKNRSVERLPGKMCDAKAQI